MVAKGYVNSITKMSLAITKKNCLQQTHYFVKHVSKKNGSQIFIVLSFSFYEALAETACLETSFASHPPEIASLHHDRKEQSKAILCREQSDVPSNLKGIDLRKY